MRFIQYLKELEGEVVGLYVRDLSVIPREDGARLMMFGRMRVFEDFVELNTDGDLSLVRVSDILAVDIMVNDGCCECDGCVEEEDDEDSDTTLWRWERDKGGLGS